MLGRFVSSAKVGGLVVQARQSLSPWLLFDDHQFRAAYNERPFLVNHRLAEHPLFEFGALAALCRRLPADQVRFRFGVVPVDTEFDTSLQRFRGELTLDDAIEHMEEKQAYIAIYNPETDPAYGPVIEGFLGEVAAHTEPIEPGLNWYSTYIFITAHDSVTPYHMDREMNFLLQIRGTKTVKLWDPRDHEIMTPAQKDLLLSLRREPRPTYKPSFERKAMTFELTPGLGVHHPFIAPHLVTTGRALSISLAITFRTHRSDVWTDAHYFNHQLRRRLGLSSGTVGRLAILDATKAGIVRLGRRTQQLLQPGRSASES
jgi:cupin-like protein